MRFAVKYCGGCNPRYDRTAFVDRLKSALGPGVKWVHAGRTEEVPDFVLVVCGCAVACAEHRDLSGLRGKLVVRSEEEYAGALERLSRLT